MITLHFDYSTFELRLVTASMLSTATATSDNNDASTTTTVPEAVTVTGIIYGRPRGLEWDPDLEEFEASLKSKKTNFFPPKVRAALPEKRPVQAPPRQPTKHLMHFANSRVWTRRNRPGI